MPASASAAALQEALENAGRLIDRQLQEDRMYPDLSELLMVSAPSKWSVPFWWLCFHSLKDTCLIPYLGPYPQGGPREDILFCLFWRAKKPIFNFFPGFFFIVDTWEGKSEEQPPMWSRGKDPNLNELPASDCLSLTPDEDHQIQVSFLLMRFNLEIDHHVL